MMGQVIAAREPTQEHHTPVDTVVLIIPIIHFCVLHNFLKFYLHMHACQYVFAPDCVGFRASTKKQYLTLLVITGYHTQVTLSFLVVGHTKFAPDLDGIKIRAQPTYEM